MAETTIGEGRFPGGLLRDGSGKILRFYKRGENIGRMSPTKTLHWMIDELEETGVEMTKGKIEGLLYPATEYHNNSRLCCLSGWKPNELAGMYRGNGPTAVSFGPAMQQAFAEGAIDRDELVRKIKKMGLEVLEY